MLDFNALAEFSRGNCISICAFLVPANIIASSLTIILTVLGRPTVQVWKSVGLASIFALVMVLHVFTWFMIGVVMLPTYILLSLAITCLLTNFAAILWQKRQMRNHGQTQSA
ncbi:MULTISPECIES: hypothetical protein [unclassified Nodularia (in: cyanobacteria)]|uniref:hypothetical protein n=1 Tax=unclassified Nodularia (in: cyanobacteria) TaxID=2656917 RepID=UPI00188166FB|nr:MULTISPECIES: hypothetical protein [unclassified Nodularia (in: cyanobacteria)]MBE9199841.1 hypothetical protein [Nodularia sp. LEGE 06071]MCC2692754.1 hypothetical protein [Nodularia sp. LEGE 04288]